MRVMNPGRNTPCPCGSTRKFKHCCGRPDAVAPGSAGVAAQVVARVDVEATARAAPWKGPGTAPGKSPSPTLKRPSGSEIGALVELINIGRPVDAETRTAALLRAHPAE